MVISMDLKKSFISEAILQIFGFPQINIIKYKDKFKTLNIIIINYIYM